MTSTDSNPEDEYADDEYADYDAEDLEDPLVTGDIPDEEPEGSANDHRQSGSIDIFTAPTS